VQVDLGVWKGKSAAAYKGEDVVLEQQWEVKRAQGCPSPISAHSSCPACACRSFIT
jgi:hypothetical protein